MKLQFNEEGYVVGYALVGAIEGGVDYSGDIPGDFETEFSHYRLKKNVLTKDPDYLSEMDRERIRARRKCECFAFVDRPMWLLHLSDARLEEIDLWYRAWLDAPQKGVIPERPDWLEGGECM